MSCDVAWWVGPWWAPRVWVCRCPLGMTFGQCSAWTLCGLPRSHVWASGDGFGRVYPLGWVAVVVDRRWRVCAGIRPGCSCPGAQDVKCASRGSSGRGFSVLSGNVYEAWRVAWPLLTRRCGHNLRLTKATVCRLRWATPAQPRTPYRVLH